MRSTRRLLVVLLVAVPYAGGFFAMPACAADPPDAPLPEITARQLADRVRESLDRYSAALLEAEFDEERNARAFGAAQDGPPEILRWSGTLKYAGDGRRWRADLDSRTISFVADQPGGKQRAKALPRHDVAGFDGERHYTTNRFGGWIIGEENPELARQCPADLFWSSLNDGETLLSTLADPKTSIRGQELHGGFRCYVVENATPDRKWRQKIVVSPRQSHLAIRIEQFYDELLAWSHVLDALRPAKNGLWYPGRITMDWGTTSDQRVRTPYIRRDIRVTTFEPAHKFGDSDFRFEPTFGEPVQDYTTGKSWFNDPWWPEISPVLARHDWPPQDLWPVKDLSSQSVPEIEGKPAPALSVGRWINSKPIEWRQLVGQVIVVHFFYGRLAGQTPQQLATLRRLHELYFAAGLEVVAIATATDRPERVEQLATELDLRFPIAVDAPAENGAGKTFNAFRLNASPQTFVVDPQGNLHHVERGKLPAAIHSMLNDAGAEDLPRIEIDSPPQISPQVIAEVDAAWPEMVRRAEAQGKISGCVTDGTAVIAGAEAVAKLRMRVLATPNVLATRIFKANSDFRAASDASGAYAVAGLPKGIYEITYSAPGKARVMRKVVIKPDLSLEALDVVLDQMDGITGQVIDDAGQPVAGARVHPRDWHFDRDNLGRYQRGSLPVEDTITNERGEFSLHGLYQGAWTFEVSAQGFVKDELKQVSPGSKDLLVILIRAKAAVP